MKIDRIVLTTDFSDCAAHAFPPTASLARRVKVGIDLVHAFEFPVAGFDITAFDPGR